MPKSGSRVFRVFVFYEVKKSGFTFLKSVLLILTGFIT